MPVASWGILGELDRAGLLHNQVPTVHAKTLEDALNQWDVMRNNDPGGSHLLSGRAGRHSYQEAFSQSTRWPSLDLDRAEGVSGLWNTPTVWKAVWRC